MIGCIGDVNIDGSLINFNNVAKLKNAEQNCQTNGFSSNNNNNNLKGPIVYPPFIYNATEPVSSENVQLKFLELNDDSDISSSTTTPIVPSIDLEMNNIPEFQPARPVETATSTVIIEDEDEDEDGYSSRSRRSCQLPTTSSNDRGKDVGYRFGDDHRESHGQVIVTHSSLNSAMNISFRFRTRFIHGLLFYSGRDGKYFP